jgi:hypothetical protein
MLSDKQDGTAASDEGAHETGTTRPPSGAGGIASGFRSGGTVPGGASGIGAGGIGTGGGSTSGADTGSARGAK